MKRGTIFIILFLIIAAGIVGASYFFQNQPPVSIRVAVHPLAEDWVRAAAERYNATEPIVNNTQRVSIRVEAVDDLTVWNAGSGWTPVNHPDAWIPALSQSVRYAAEAGVPFTVEQTSVAATPLVWGGFTDAVDTVTNGGAVPLGWEVVAAHLADIEPALPNPASSAQGLAAVLTGAAELADTPTLTRTELGSSFQTWLTPTLNDVANFNTFGSSVAQTIAARGPSVGSVAILPEVEWVNNLTGQLVRTANPIEFQYPAYNIVFDFPYTSWAGTTDPAAPQVVNLAAVQAGVGAFGQHLLSAAEQDVAQTVGLRPAGGTVSADADLFTNARAYGILPTPDLSQRVQFPGRNDARSLISWLEGVTR